MATSVNFDKNSVEILKKVESIHRESLVNLGIALISKTNYYKTLIGEIPEDINKVVSLESLEDELNGDKSNSNQSNSKSAESESKPSTSSWDDF